MKWKLERGGGAFQVDALSGWDLYDMGAPTCSKVVTAEQSEFHQLAALRRGNNHGANYGEIQSMEMTIYVAVVEDTSNTVLMMV